MLLTSSRSAAILLDMLFLSSIIMPCNVALSGDPVMVLMERDVSGS